MKSIALWLIKFPETSRINSNFKQAKTSPRPEGDQKRSKEHYQKRFKSEESMDIEPDRRQANYTPTSTAAHSSLGIKKIRDDMLKTIRKESM